MDNVALPCGLQSLTSDGRFNLSMDIAVLPGASEYSTVACRVGIQLALISSGGFCVSVLYQAASSSQ